MDGLFHRTSCLHRGADRSFRGFRAYFGERASHSMERNFRFMERKAQIGSLTREVPGHSSRAEEYHSLACIVDGEVVFAHDLHGSILALLGIDHKKLTFHFQGRDFRLTDVAGDYNIAPRLLSS